MSPVDAPSAILASFPRLLQTTLANLSCLHPFLPSFIFDLLSFFTLVLSLFQKSDAHPKTQGVRQSFGIKADIRNEKVAKDGARDGWRADARVSSELCRLLVMGAA